MNKFFITALCTVAFAVQAEFVKNPDENTLWREDGREIVVRDTLDKSYWKGAYWQLDKIKVEPVENGFKVFGANSTSGCNMRRVVPVSAGYPYLVAELTAFAPASGYNSFTLGQSKLNTPAFVMTRTIFPVTVVLRRFAPDANVPASESLSFYFYGGEYTFAKLAMVRRPEQFIEIQPDTPVAVGTKLKFRVNLSAPAKDVSLKFTSIKGVPVKFNGAETLQMLPPEGSDDKIWEAELDVQSIVHPDKVETVPVLVFANILDGKTPRPVVTMFQIKK